MLVIVADVTEISLKIKKGELDMIKLILKLGVLEIL
jgi:hypothetical protein